MRIDRINQYIADLEEVSKQDLIDMQGWQSTVDAEIPAPISRSVWELHQCGNRACAAGFLALTPAFAEAGGEFSDEDGEPVLGTAGGSQAFARYFALSPFLAKTICYGSGGSADANFRLYSEMFRLVGKGWSQWDANDLIKIMRAVAQGEIQ